MSKKQIIKRLLQIVIVLIGISFITFALTFMSPGDPVRNMYTATGVMPTEEMVQETREELGLNDPFLVQYTRWLKNCLKGDFGKSYSLNKPVTELLAARLWPTLKLTLMAMILMLVISVPLGMLSAIYKDKWIDYLVRGITFLGCAMPNFWVGLLLMLAFCVYINAFPVISSAGDFKSLFLPALTLAIAMSSKYTRQVRTAVLDELSQDYVIGAQARGVKKSKIIWGNVFPNSLLPLITMFGLSIGSLLGGTSVVEVIFSYPGLGNLAVSAITSSDYNLIQGYVLWLALIYMVINLIVDASYVGTVTGVLAGYFGGVIDAVIMRIADMMLAFPGLVLALAVAGIMGASIKNAIIAIVVVSWTKYARLARSLVMKIRDRDYVSAAIVTGSKTPYMLFRYMLPNALPTLIITAATDIGSMMLELAAMSFLGFGAKPPAPEWGYMLNEGRACMQSAPWLMIFPGLAIFVVVVVFNMLGDSIRDILDPRNE